MIKDTLYPLVMGAAIAASGHLLVGAIAAALLAAALRS